MNKFSPVAYIHIFYFTVLLNSPSAEGLYGPTACMVKDVILSAIEKLLKYMYK